MPNNNNTNGRSYVSGKFGLELDHSAAGWLWGAEGGMPTAEVIQEKVGPDHLPHKHSGGVKYEDIGLTFGTGMSKNFWQWLEDSFNYNYSRRSGAIVGANFDHHETSRLSFYNALATELAFPALDAAAKDPAKVNCKLTPEYTRYAVSPSGGARIGGSENRTVQRKWHRSDFRVRIDGLDDRDTRRVVAVDSISLKQKVQQHNVGEVRDYQVEPTQIEYPNI